MPREPRPHLFWPELPEVRDFRSVSSGGSNDLVLPRNREAQSRSLRGQLQVIADNADATFAMLAAAGDAEEGYGLLLEFESFPDAELAFESLGREDRGITLRSVQQEGNILRASVFVKRGKLEHFERLIAAYIERRRKANGDANDNQRLIDTIRVIRRATLRDLWTDEAALFPEDAMQPIAWEVWLPSLEQVDVVDRFRRHARAAGLVVQSGHLQFAERTIVWVRGSLSQWEQSLPLVSCIAEIRKAKETAEFFDGLNPVQQGEWVDELLARSSFPVADACPMSASSTPG